MKQYFTKSMKAIWWFVLQTIDPKGKISAPSLIGLTSCFAAILGFMNIIAITNASKLFEWGLFALALAAGESITAIIKKK